MTKNIVQDFVATIDKQQQFLKCVYIQFADLGKRIRRALIR